MNPQPIQVDSWYWLKRWMACEPTANTSWQLIFLVAIICGSHSCRCVNCDHLCTHGDIFCIFCCIVVCISTLYIPILNCGQIRQYQTYISVSVCIRPYISVSVFIRPYRITRTYADKLIIRQYFYIIERYIWILLPIITHWIALYVVELSLW